jgi:hypothetical protein
MERAYGQADSDRQSGRDERRDASRQEQPSEGRGRVAGLHRAVGNQAVRSLHERGELQAKLSVGRAGDATEREAERVADSVTGVDDRNGDRDVTVRRKPTGDSVTVDRETERQVDPVTRGGRPLPGTTRSRFEERFGRDFSDVRVHTGADADAAARSIDAEAFTLGSDVAFASGNYRPGTTEGDRLLAHELTHVLQQRGDGHGRSRVQRQPGDGSSGGSGSGTRQLLREAIDLFAASDASTSQLGRSVQQRLESLYANEEIEVEDLEGDTLGVTRNDPGLELHYGTLVTPVTASWEEKVAIDEAIRRNVTRVSLTLVHEAVHVVKDRKYVEEELLCRNTELDFFQELLYGVTANGVTYLATRSAFPGMETQLEKRKLDQLVDVVFGIYYDEEGFYDAEWVENHLDDWGGLSNRWRFTKAMYLKKLVADSKSHSESVLSILESETDTALKFRQMILWADMDRDDLREYFSDTYMLHVTEYVRRIERIEQETGLDLIEAT